MTKNPLRLRVFAGPNGSGKSTVVKSVNEAIENDRPIDLGYYINADEIAKNLRENKFSFKKFPITVDKDEFVRIASESGIIRATYTTDIFTHSFSLEDDKLSIINKNKGNYEIIAQIIADFLRKKLLAGNQKFSFETVFSHPSKMEIMKTAQQQGYKVYLYFVSTEDPEINIFRVKDVRVPEGGHDVDEGRIRDRYYRSLQNMYGAAQLAYQAFFFDNSGDRARLFTHFRINSDGKKEWSNKNTHEFPNWFNTYYRMDTNPHIKTGY